MDQKRQPDQKILEHTAWDSEGKEIAVKGRVRLSPYYFVSGDTTVVGGALATLCPPDKKKIHGMQDAVLVPLGV